MVEQKAAARLKRPNDRSLVLPPLTPEPTLPVLIRCRIADIACNDALHPSNLFQLDSGELGFLRGNDKRRHVKLDGSAVNHKRSQSALGFL